MTHAPDPDAPTGPHRRSDSTPGPAVPVGTLRHQLVGAKGGQGTTTVALALAALVAEHRPAAVSSTRPGDLAALAGVAPGDGPHPLAPPLDLVGPGEAPPGAVLVEDLGRLDDLGDAWPGRPPPGTRRWLVVRGPCYLALRCAVEAPWRPDGVVVVSEPGRALGDTDVADVLGVDVVARVDADADVARRIDAGLLLAGPRPLRPFRYLVRLVAPDLLRLGERDAPATPHPPPAGTDAPTPPALGDITALPAPATGAGLAPGASPPAAATPVAPDPRPTEEAMPSLPYLRPLSPDDAPAPCPPGHAVEPAGVWKGQSMEVVYDPRRHDVAFLRGETTLDVRSGLVATGWSHQSSDGEAQMWVRDRVALAQARLARTTVRLGPPRIA